jgi:hypothetical protein
LFICSRMINQVRLGSGLVWKERWIFLQLPNMPVK